MKKSTKPTLKIETQSELARRLNCDPAQITRYLRDERWTFPRKAPWNESDIAAIQRWRAEALETGSDIPDSEVTGELLELRKSKLTQEIRRLKASAESEELSLGKLKNELIEIREVKQWIGEHITRAKNQFLGMATALAPRLVGMDTAEIQTAIESHVEQVINEVREAEKNL